MTRASVAQMVFALCLLTALAVGAEEINQEPPSENGTGIWRWFPTSGLRASKPGPGPHRGPGLRRRRRRVLLRHPAGPRARCDGRDRRPLRARGRAVRRRLREGGRRIRRAGRTPRRRRLDSDPRQQGRRPRAGRECALGLGVVALAPHQSRRNRGSPLLVGRPRCPFQGPLFNRHIGPHGLAHPILGAHRRGITETLSVSLSAMPAASTSVASTRRNDLDGDAVAQLAAVAPLELPRRLEASDAQRSHDNDFR